MQLDDSVYRITGPDGTEYSRIDTPDGSWLSAVEQTATGYGSLNFTGSRNNDVKSLKFFGKCEQGNNPSPTNPQTIKVNNSIWTVSGYNQIDLTGRPLCGIQAKDEVDYISGKCIQRIGSTKLDNWWFNQYGSHMFWTDFRDATITNVAGLKCAQFSASDAYWQSIPNNSMTLVPGFNVGGVSALMFRADAYSDVTAFNTFINTVTLYYELKTPINFSVTPRTITYGRDETIRLNQIAGDASNTEVQVTYIGEINQH